MNQNGLIFILEKFRAIQTGGHFVYTGGDHGDTYINKDALYAHPRYMSSFAREIALKLKNKIDIVVGPERGGMILAQWVSWHISEIVGGEVLSAYAEKNGNSFIIRRGYEKLIKEKRVLVVDDILRTGNSFQRTIEAVRAVHGNIVSGAVLCNRSIGNQIQFDIGEFFALAEIPLQSWAEDMCPLCKLGIPINTDIGHGKNILRDEERGYL